MKLGFTAVFMAVAGAFLPSAARADFIKFAATGTFQDGSTLSGFVNIDTGTGLAGTADLAVSGIPAHFTTFDLQRTWPSSGPFMTEFEFANGQASNNLLTFLFPPVSLVGYSGGSLYGTSSNVGFFSNFATRLPDGTIPATSFVELDSGSLSPAVPLPASMWGGGAILGLMAGWRLLRRKPLASSSASSVA